MFYLTVLHTLSFLKRALPGRVTYSLMGYLKKIAREETDAANL